MQRHYREVVKLRVVDISSIHLVINLKYFKEGFMSVQKYLVTVAGETHYVTAEQAEKLALQAMENDPNCRRLSPEEIEYYYGVAA